MIKLTRTVLIIAAVFLVLTNFYCKSGNDKQTSSIYESLKLNIGEEFPYKEFLDSSGALTKIDYSKNELTIIDFWFKNCPPCIEEMKKFEKLAAGKKVVILSVSINSFKEWKNALNDTSARLRFLKNSVPNWYHYMMKSDADPRLNNPISFDVMQSLTKDLGVAFFPAYFVLDKSGKIVERPESAVEYLQKL